MDWHKSQTITTAILAAWNIGVLAALVTGILSLLVMHRMGLETLSAGEGAAVKLLSVVVGVAAATLCGKLIIPAIKSLSRLWSTVLLLVLVFATFALFPTKFAFMPT